MEKDFDLWNEQKKKIDKKNNYIYFNEREIWWCRLGLNVGREQDGKGENFTRPVLILKKCSLDTCIIIPLTKVKKTGAFYYSCNIKSCGMQNFILSHIRLIDTKRLISKFALLDAKDIAEIKKKITHLFKV